MSSSSTDSAPTSLGEMLDAGSPTARFVPPAVERSDLQSRVRSQLRLAILSGDLKPGQRLQQASLAKAFGVSTSPLREAIRDLVAAGLLNAETYAGATVHVPSAAELTVIGDMRVALMPVTVGQAVKCITDEELDEAERIVEALRSPMPKVEWVELNRHFHSLLDAACRVNVLSDTMRRLDDLMSLYVNLDPTSRNNSDYRVKRNDEHVAILRAYRDRDVERAIELNVEHVRRTIEGARRAIGNDGLGGDQASPR